jgi:hypothetical protein
MRSTPDHLPPTATLPGKLLRHPRNLVTIELFSSPILFIAGIHFPPILLHNQGLPDPLNLPNAATPLPEYHHYLPVLCFSPTRAQLLWFRKFLGVFCKFSKVFLFQISELLHFIDFRKKFINVQNQFCLIP